MLETSTSLLRQLRAGNDAGAWGRFVSLYTPYLYGWLLRQGVQHADAEDLVQETLAVVAGQVKRFEHNHRLGAFRCWLRRTLVNQLRVLRRSQKVRSTTLANSAHLLSLAEALEDPKGSLARIWEHDHDRYVVRKLLERIEPDFQPSTWQAFRLAVLQGTEPEQVAAELGISVDSVYAAKSRVLKRLRQEAEGLLD